MRWSGWILAAAVVGYAGVASGQPGCVGCGGRSAAWLALSGEAGCSPPGYSLSAWVGPRCCCANQQPCCDNAWDGYCEHHARVQAFWAQVGVPKCRCCPAAMPRMQMRVYTVCPECSPSANQPTASPSAVQPTPSLAPIPAPSKEAPKSPLPPIPDSPGVRAVPSVPPAAASPKSASSVTPDSALPNEPPMPPDEAFRELGQSWLR